MNQVSPSDSLICLSVSLSVAYHEKCVRHEHVFQLILKLLDI